MKITKFISLVLSVCMILMCLPVSFIASAESYSYEIGPGTGTSTSTNVAQLVDTVIQPNTTASDEVTVYVTNQGSGNAYTPDFFSWRNRSDTPHAATVTYTTKQGEEKANIYSGDAFFTLYGNSIFRNIRIYVNDLGRGIMTGGHNCTIENTAEVVNAGYSAYAKLYVGGLANQGTAVATGDGITTVDGVNFDGYYSGALGAVILGSGYYSPTIPGNQTFISKNNTINLAFSGESNTTFNQNLNIILENSQVARSYPAWTADGSTYVSGAIQILANGNSVIDKDSLYSSATNSNITATGGVYLLDSTGDTNGSLMTTATAGIYTVTSDKTYAYAYNADNAVVYYGTDTLTVGAPGKYTVGYVNNVEDIPFGGVVQLYNNGVAAGRLAQYYLSPGGSGDGRTISTPASSVDKIITAIQQDTDNNGTGLTVYIRVTGGENDTYAASDYARNWDGWPDTAYTNANLIITSLTDTPAILEFGRNNPSINLFTWGNTTFENIVLYNRDSVDNGYFVGTNGYDTTIGDNVTFVYGTGTLYTFTTTIFSGTAYFGVIRDAGGVVTINNTGSNKNYYLAYGSFATNSLEGTHTFVVNGGTVNNVYLNYRADNDAPCAFSTTALNLVLNNATLNAASAGSNNLTMTGAIQILANKNSTLPASISSIKSYASANSVPLYIMDAGTDVNGALNVTATVGTYSVDSECTYAYAYDFTNHPDTVYYGTDTLTVPGEGEYTVGYTNDLASVLATFEGLWEDNGDGTCSNTFEFDGCYFTAPGGTGDGRTKATPAGSITSAYQTILNDGYSANDEVYIYVEGTGSAGVLPSGAVENFSWPWPNINDVQAATPANITITTTPGSAVKGVIEYATSNEEMNILAHTTFKNIVLCHSYSAGIGDLTGADADEKGFGIATNGYNVTFDDDVDFYWANSSGDMYWRNPYIYIGNIWNRGVRCDQDTTVTINGDKSFHIVFGGLGNTDPSVGTDATAMVGNKTVVVNGGTVKSVNLSNYNRATTCDGDLALILNNATLQSANVNKASNVNLPTIDGAISIIANNGSSLPASISNIKTFADTNGYPCYIVDASSRPSGFLRTTATPGVYNVDEGLRVAVADTPNVVKQLVLNGTVDLRGASYTGKYTVSINTLGDVDNDGEVLDDDIRHTAKYLVDNGTYNGFYDVNEDGRLDIKDAVAVKKMFLP